MSRPFMFGFLDELEKIAISTGSEDSQADTPHPP